MSSKRWKCIFVVDKALMYLHALLLFIYETKLYVFSYEKKFERHTIPVKISVEFQVQLSESDLGPGMSLSSWFQNSMWKLLTLSYWNKRSKTCFLTVKLLPFSISSKKFFAFRNYLLYKFTGLSLRSHLRIFPKGLQKKCLGSFAKVPDTTFR